MLSAVHLCQGPMLGESCGMHCRRKRGSCAANHMPQGKHDRMLCSCLRLSAQQCMLELCA